MELFASLVFKEDADRQLWYEGNAHAMLKHYVEWALTWWWVNYGITHLTCTSFWRAGDPMHGTGRAIDMRIRDLPRGSAELFAWTANQMWRYSNIPGKERFVTCLYGSYDKNLKHNDHMHWQVPCTEDEGPTFAGL